MEDLSENIQPKKQRKCLTQKQKERTKEMKVSIGKKLTLGFGVVVVLTAILGLVGISKLRDTNNIWKEAKDSGLAIEKLSLQFEVDLLNARRREKDFLLRYKEGIEEAKQLYITSRFDTDVEAVERGLDEIKKIGTTIGDKEHVATIEKMKDLTSNYASGVHEVVKLVEERGHKDTGIIGELRQKIHTVEKEVKEANLVELNASMLECRRNEKDFLLRTEKQYVEKHNESVTLLKFKIKSSDLSESTKSKLVSLVDDYNAKFLEVTQITDNISKKIDNLREAAHAVENMGYEVVEQGCRTGDESIRRALALEKPTTIVMTAALALAIILGGAASVLITRSLTNPIRNLIEATKKMAAGDLTVKSTVESSDEIGQFSASFNNMADEIQKRNEELQTMNEELQSTNEELESSNEELRSTTEELEASNEELQSTTEELEASNEELRTANEELETTQEKLIQQEKLAAVGQLASGVGHELRNPLGVIKNAAYYIRTKIGTDDPKLAKHLTIMEREINNSNRIISDLLGFSRTRLPSITPSDINKIVDSAMEVVEMPENILLVKEFGTSLPKTMVDPDQMHQVFVNLGLNAVQAMTEGGQLKVKTKLAGDYVEVEFSDTGCGIPQENLKKLFDPFFSTKARGVGLGLAVTHGIIERNKCKIEVESKVSEGTTFVVTLPVERRISEKEAIDKQKVTVG